MKYVLFFLFSFFVQTSFSQDTVNKEVKKRDKSKIPLLMNGKFLTKSILITPSIHMFNNDTIGDRFQRGDTTDLGSYLRSKFHIDTLSQIFVDEEHVTIRFNEVIKCVKYLKFDTLYALPYKFNYNKNKIGHFSYNVPLINKNIIEEFVQGKFDFPIMQLSLKVPFQINTDNHISYYLLIIFSQLTHRIEFENRKNYVPLIYPK